MSNPHVNRSNGRPYPSSVAREEEKAWIGFYRRVREPYIAQAVVELLSADADLKKTHLALFLRCNETLRIARERQARAKRIGGFVRWVCAGLVCGPIRGVRNLTRESAQVAAECLPEVQEPAKEQVRRIAA